MIASLASMAIASMSDRANASIAAQTSDELSNVVGHGLTARDWAVAGITLAVFLVAGRVLRTVVVRLVRRTDSEGAIARIVGRLVQNLVTLVGFVYTLSVLEVQIGPLLGALGVTGIAVAFAITAILENVFASVLLKTRRPIRIGDQISTNGVDGTVVEVNYRSVVLTSYDGEKVVVPSALVSNDVIVNHTAETSRRTVVPVGVAYSTDLRNAQSVLLQAVADVDGVRESPAPQAMVTSFGASSIDFDVRYWHDPDIATVYRVRSEVAIAIKEGFDAAGIQIPFPQRVVTMVPESHAQAAGDPPADDTSDQARSSGEGSAGGSTVERG